MRRPHDAYYTPASACEVLKRHWEGWTYCCGHIEPCKGDGAIVKAFPEVEWMTHDIDPSCNPDNVDDMTDPKNWLRYDGRDNCVITNPPFSCAFQILTNALWTCSKVAMLLRLSFLEPTKERGTFLGNNPPDLVIVLPRISFTGDGKTDSVTCAWMIWDGYLEAHEKGVIVEPRE